MLIERANYNIFDARCTASSSAENLGLVGSDTVSRIFHHPLTYHHNPEDMNLQEEDCTVKCAIQIDASDQWLLTRGPQTLWACKAALRSREDYCCPIIRPKKKHRTKYFHCHKMCAYGEITLRNANSARQNMKFCHSGFHNLCF